MTKKQIDRWARWMYLIVTLVFVLALVWVESTRTSTGMCGSEQGFILLLAFLMGMLGTGMAAKD